MRTKLGLALVLVVAFLPGLYAQTATGAVYGLVADESGAVLPGAAVTLAGAMGSRTAASGTQGEFRFLNVLPGSYTLTVGLSGFSNVSRAITVITGTNVDLSFRLKVAILEETVTVTGEQPIVDTKKTGTGVTLTREELNSVPQSRDPWAILRTIPGVIVDRVNIAGNESGQQSQFLGKGADQADNIWNLDGVAVTDMSAAGASPTYFDYDAFEEVNVTTGGADLKAATGGVSLNFVTKRGTNAFHGSLRGFFTHDKFQSENLPDELANDVRVLRAAGLDPDNAGKADHIAQIADYGIDLGGPIIKNKLWFYGSYGKQDVRNVRLNGTPDKTLLPSYNAKINWQATADTMVSGFYFVGAKQKFGRGVGFPGITVEPDSWLWNQDNLYPGGPHGLVKGEINHTFSSNLFATAKYAYYGTGFSLSPRGGAELGGVNFATGTATGSFLFYGSKRPQHTANVDFNYFTPGMGGNHELKFGFGYRKVGVTSSSVFGGNKLFGLRYTASSDPDEIHGYAYITRDRAFAADMNYLSAYAGDTFTKDRWTVNLGTRFDRQKGRNQPSVAAANPAFPDILGALDFDGAGQGAEWTDVSPRVSLSYALDEARKTVLRASFARYAGQLNSGDVTWDNPNTGYGYLAYLWNDRNADGLAQPGELLTDEGVQYSGPGDPRLPISPNVIDPDYRANRDNEFIVGLDRELAPNLALSAAYTNRRSTGITGWKPRIGFVAADYALVATPAAHGFTGQLFAPDPDKVAETNNGRLQTNRPDYHRTYSGFELNLLKRLSHRWMARVALTLQDWKEYYDGPGAIDNPTRTTRSGGTTISTHSGPQVNGGQFAPAAGGSGKGGIFTNAKWQFVANALYQLPAGFEVAASAFGRQGNPRPIQMQLVGGADGGRQTLVVPELDSERVPNVWNLDARVAKNFKLQAVTLTAAAEVFNILNNNVTLNLNPTTATQSGSTISPTAAYNVTTGRGTFNRIDEILSPRIARFSLRLSF